jgi:hypothetical protein
MLVRLFLPFALIVALGGCGQPDGAVPQPATEDEVNKTRNLSRGLLDVASKSRGAVEDLRANLSNLDGLTMPEPLMDKVAQRLEIALAGNKLSEDLARTLATQLFVARTARELSKRQIDDLRGDIGQLLVNVGADRSAAERVGDAIEEMQLAVTTKRRRWWHL